MYEVAGYDPWHGKFAYKTIKLGSMIQIVGNVGNHWNICTCNVVLYCVICYGLG